MTEFPLDIQGSLSLTGNRGDEVSLRAAGDVIALDVGSAGALLRLVAVGGGRASRGKRVVQLQRALSATGQRLELRLSGVRIGLLAEGTRAGLLAWALGAGPVRLEVLALLRALFRGQYSIT